MAKEATEENKLGTQADEGAEHLREVAKIPPGAVFTPPAGTFFMCPVYPTAVGQDMMRVATAKGASAPCQVLALGVYMSAGQRRPSVQDTYMLVAITIPEWHPATNLFNDKEAAEHRSYELAQELKILEQAFPKAQ